MSGKDPSRWDEAFAFNFYLNQIKFKSGSRPNCWGVGGRSLIFYFYLNQIKFHILYEMTKWQNDDKMS